MFARSSLCAFALAVFLTPEIRAELTAEQQKIAFEADSPLSITKELAVTKFIYYADDINENDLWNGFEKRLQQGNDLGERMQNAFQELYTAGFTKVCIIGSDCYELSSDIITNAFEKLNEVDVAIGPVTDGGYYLLGSNKMIPQLFTNKAWSTNTVFADTLKDATVLNLYVHQLPVLHDIDNEKDLRNSPLAFFI